MKETKKELKGHFSLQETLNHPSELVPYGRLVSGRH